MDTFIAATPSPPRSLRTPPTPKHGYGDSWEPYSSRKSARISSQRTTSAARTPSPQSSSSKPQSHHFLRSPQTSRRDYSNNTMSPAASPKKRKRDPAMDSTRRAPGHLTAESAASAAAALGLPSANKKVESSRQGRASASTAAGMLITPAKTPSRKQSSLQNEANIAAIARNLFHSDEEVMPSAAAAAAAATTTTGTKRKRTKKYAGFSLESFTAVEDEDPIQIFTDTRERIPEVDESTDNPFVTTRSAAVEPEAAKRRSKRRQVAIPGEGTQTVEEAIRRDDGLVYVFRGKKMFRKFETDEDSGAVADETESDQNRRLTRSYIKPRRLFPTKPSSPEVGADADEEAPTDIEDGREELEEAGEEAEPSTPAKLVSKMPGTPEAPRFAPASPPTTVRATRSGKKAAFDATPVKSTRGRSKRSPFYA